MIEMIILKSDGHVSREMFRCFRHKTLFVMQTDSRLVLCTEMSLIRILSHVCLRTSSTVQRL